MAAGKSFAAVAAAAQGIGIKGMQTSVVILESIENVIDGSIVEDNNELSSSEEEEQVKDENEKEQQQPNSVDGSSSIFGHPAAMVPNSSSSSMDSDGGCEQDIEDLCDKFLPMPRSGGWADIGSRKKMEDEHVRIDDLMEHLGPCFSGEVPGAFYGVFDGHDGKDAAEFVRKNLLRFIIEDGAYPLSVDIAVKRAFLHTDNAFAQACVVDGDLSSGTTALAAIVLGRRLLVANAGDCRAVLCKRGKAIEMSRDHKASCSLEKDRIEACGGYVYDGYLNGQLSVARALGDWHMEGLKTKGVEGPLTAEPEMQQRLLTEDDEFLIIGCDGLWDVFSSQDAVNFARRRLQVHNDPERCSKELIDEALRRDTSDNLTVLTVCLHAEPPPRLRPLPMRSISLEGLRNLQGLLDSLP